jgi:putative PEP-CTERM system TPR-repeat lipoprotein
MNKHWVSPFRPLLAVLITVTLAACGAFASADRIVARARAHFEDGQFRSAMAEVKTALEREPQHGEGRLLLAELSFWLGDVEGSEKELARALAAGLPAARTSDLHYELLLARNRYDEVLAALPADKSLEPAQRSLFEARAHDGRQDYAAERQVLDAALAQTPQDPGLLLQSARLNVAKGELQRALQITERITQPPVMQARALYIRGMILRARGEHAQAREALDRAHAAGRKRLPTGEQMTLLVALAETALALNDPDAASKAVDDLAKLTPESVATHYLRARVALAKNDAVVAVAECQRALRIDPDNKPSGLLLAAAHLSHGSYEQAEAVLDRLLSSDPTNVAAAKLLAQVHLGRHEPAEARRVLSTMADASRADADLDWLLGTALLQSGDAAGLAALERSVAGSPNAAKRVELAAAYIAAGTPGKAVDLLKAVPPDSPLSDRAQHLLFLASVAGKKPQEARQEIERLVAADPDNVPLLTAAGAQLATMGDVLKARELLERAARLDPKAVPARWALAQLAARSQDHERAAQLLRQILALEPANQRAHVGLSELAWYKGDHDAAQKWLEQAVSANPGAVEPRLRLAQLAFVSGDAPRGKSLLDQAIGVATDRKSVLSAAGRVLARAGLVEEALAKYKEAATAGASQATLDAAQLYVEIGRLDDARQLLEAAVVEKPNWQEAARLLAKIEARDGRLDQALARVRGLNEQVALAKRRELEGDVYAVAKRWPDAVAAYEDAQRLQPSAGIAVKMFTARRAAGQATPERSLTQWLRESPDDADVRRALAAYYETSGRSAEAIAEYEQLLAADRIDPAALNNLAWMLHARGDARAAKLAKRAYDAAPTVAEIADSYGWILVQTDKVPEGMAVLERALAGAPANPDIQYHMAAAYVKSGQSARGAELLRDALQSHEKFASRQEAERLERSLASTTPPGGLSSR